MRVITQAIENDDSFRNGLLDCGLISLRDCTDDENEKYLAMNQADVTLPDGVIASKDDSTKFVQVLPKNLSSSDELNMIEYLKLKELSRIGGWVSFFGVLTVISLIISLVVVLVK